MADLVAERYELLEVLGHGGDTEVVQAVDRQHDRQVALKVRRVGPDEAREPLLAESRALLELEPPPALPVVRDDFFLDDRHVLVMDWVDGTNVSLNLSEMGPLTLLARRGPGDVERAAQLLERARTIAEDIGMQGVLADVGELEPQLSDA